MRRSVAPASRARTTGLPTWPGPKRPNGSGGPPPSGRGLVAAMADLAALGLGVTDLAVEWARLEQLGVRAGRDDPPVVEDQDLVGAGRGADALRDDDARLAARPVRQCGLDARLGRDVDRAGAVVEDQDRRIGQERPR